MTCRTSEPETAAPASRATQLSELALRAWGWLDRAERQQRSARDGRQAAAVVNPGDRVVLLRQLWSRTPGVYPWA